MADTATVWYDGEGLPTNDVGLAGDYYLNISNADIYKKISNSWQRIGNIRGSQGLQGEKGDQGDKGVKGDRGDIGPAGPQGLQGTMGKAGSIWYDGIGAPDTNLGIINDFYLDIFNGDIYKKKGATYWERVSSFLPDLTYYLEQIDALLARGDSVLESFNSSFNANMSNMANTFNTNINSFRNTFNNNMSSMQESVNLFITEKGIALDNRFQTLADVTVQGELLNARVSITGNTFNSLQERLQYDFNNATFPANVTIIANLNAITKTGFYGASNSNTAPSLDNYLILHMQDSTTKSQLALKTGTSLVYARTYANAGWTSWLLTGPDIDYASYVTQINNNKNRLR